MQNFIDKLMNSHLPPLHKNNLNFAFLEYIPSPKKISVKKSLKNAFHFFSDLRNKQSLFSTNRENNYPTMRSVRTQSESRLKVPSINLKKFLNKYVVSIFVVLAVIASVYYLITNDSGNSQVSSSSQSQVKVQGVISETTPNQEFQFPLMGSDGEVLSNIKFEIVDASLRDVVSVQGQKAYPTENKLFLILGVKITNDLDQPIEMSTKDYVRLVVNGNQEELLAPEMHNDPVEIQAISTKKTRLGFSVDRNDSDFVLKVGEINGEKQDVTLNLNK